ncbi:MAG: preprotein translocase subunit SecE [Candidatus Saccharicenans sp.]|jgi:preprotein translocase subunit SecE|nr:preprotein translocase subunit SecE [Candidatus Aminicenantes bacterium]
MSEKLPWYKRLVNYLKDVRSELKKVTWPTKQEVYGTTIIVIIAIFFFGFYLFFVDVIFSWVIVQIKNLLG